MVKEEIRRYAKTLGITEFGAAKTPDGKTVLVFLFPYFVGAREGNISLYARSSDYHIIVKKYLLKIAEYIGGMDLSVYCDINPLNERELAHKAGLGFYGKNNMLINPVYGSYFFIGCITADNMDIPLDSPLDMTCSGCGRCIKSCPGGALSCEGFEISRCASELSQKKGELSPDEEAIILKSGLFWGCDKCQEVCPHNKNIPITPISEFKENLIDYLPERDIISLSGRAFLKKYPDRAFTWRGKNVLLRNINIYKNGKDI